MRWPWEWWKIRRSAAASLKKIERTDLPPPEFSDILQNEAVLPNVPETVEQVSVTGIYKNVANMVQEVIESKKQTQESAKRITTAIGAPPEPAKK